MTGRFAGSLTLTDVNGVTIRYQRRGNGPPVLLLHPLRMQLEYFEPVCSRLGDAGVELISVDLPGHGHSGAPAVDYSASYFTSTVEAFLDSLNVVDAIVVGESIGASIGLGLAARHSKLVAGVVALNPYDYGRWGGIRRSSTVGNIVFTTMLLPIIGAVVAQAGTRSVLRRVIEGGFYDPRHLSPQLVDELYLSGRLPGHGRALRSLSRNWRSWISARDNYPAIQVPVALAYGDHDWSNEDEREANRRTITTARATTIRDSGHFSARDKPDQVTALIKGFLSLP
jgi:pimeloyl-ACP methyl ester carboxylesterase